MERVFRRKALEILGFYSIKFPSGHLRSSDSPEFSNQLVLTCLLERRELLPLRMRQVFEVERSRNGRPSINDYYAKK